MSNSVMIPEDALPYVRIACVDGYFASWLVQQGVAKSDRTAAKWMKAFREDNYRTSTANGHTYTQSDVPEDKPPTTNYGVGAMSASSVGETITNDEQLIEACNIDMSRWQIKKCEVKTYQVYRKNHQSNLSFSDGRIDGYIHDEGDMSIRTLYSVSAEFVPNVAQVVVDIIGEAVEKLKQTKVSHTKVGKRPAGEYLFCPQISDVHIGRMSTDGNSTIEQQGQIYLSVGRALIEKVCNMNLKIDRIMIPVGNDILDFDNLQYTTTKGTQQFPSGDIRDAAREACFVTAAYINDLRQVAPVDVLAIPSNHDRMGVYWLGLFLNGYFHNDPHVTVNYDKHPRKYYSYGSTLIGLEHGDNVRSGELAAIMATEAPGLWASTRFHEWNRGHLHRVGQVYHPVFDDKGVTVITHAALAVKDDWEILKGYIGPERSAEGRLYHREYGPAGNFPVFVNEVLPT